VDTYMLVVFVTGVMLADATIGINSSSLIISTISAVLTILLAVVAFFIKGRLSRLDTDIKELETKMDTCQQTHLQKDGKQDEEIQIHAKDLVEIKTRLTGMDTTLQKVEASNEDLRKSIQEYGSQTNEGLKMILQFLEQNRRRNGGRQD